MTRSQRVCYPPSAIAAAPRGTFGIRGEGQFSEFYEKIQPYQQKEAVRLVLHKAILSKTSIKIALYGRQPDTELFTSQALRFGTSEWRPGVTLNEITLILPHNLTKRQKLKN